MKRNERVGDEFERAVEHDCPSTFHLFSSFIHENHAAAPRCCRGESYLDVIARLEPIIMEMERHREPLLIVGHQGILRIIYAFYMGLSRAEAPYVSVPLNCVLQLVPSAFSCEENVRHFILLLVAKSYCVSTV